MSAEVSTADLRAALGNHDAVEWSVEESRNWSIVGGQLVLTSPFAGRTHYIEAVVNGPGVMEWGSLYSASLKFEGAILVDGVQSGGKVDRYSRNRVQVGEGGHIIRWQLKNIALSRSQPAVVKFNPVVWNRFSEVPLQAAGVSSGVVMLSGDWVGQDSVHLGDGSAAWSGIQLFGLPSEVPIEPVMRAEFVGPGVFSYHYLAGGAAGKVRQDEGGWEAMVSVGNWQKVMKWVSEGDHVIEWKAASETSEYRGDRDLVIDEIRILEEVSLADALTTPELIWERIDGGQGNPFGVEDPAAKRGTTVIIPGDSSISTHFPGERIVRIRFKGRTPRVIVGTEPVTVEILADDPEVVGTDRKIAVVLVPAGGGTVQISPYAYGPIEVDSVEWILPPSSITATLSLADTITSGGTGTWVPVPGHRLGRYVVGLTVSDSSPEGWFEFPVTGPAEVAVTYAGQLHSAKIHLLVDGRPVWDSEGGSTVAGPVTIEIPAGTHLLRCLGRKTSYREAHLQITAITVTELAEEGKLGTAMDYPGAWASLGGWESSGDLTYDGVDALRPEPLSEPYRNESVVQAPVTGPGYVSFMTYVMNSPETTYSTPIGWASDVHHTVSRRFTDEPQGWMKHRTWFPPGEHWIRWDVLGTAHDLSLVAIDGMEFEASESLTFDEMLGTAGGIWESDPDRPWSVVRKDPGGDAFIVSQMINPTEPSSISLTIQGPGEIGFHWRNGEMEGAEGELWIDGVKTSEKLPRSKEGESVAVIVPRDGAVTLEWRFEAPFDGNWVAMEDFGWTPWPEVPLAEALDAPVQVVWRTSGELPFKGRLDNGARNGSAAQVGLMPGEETWLEATVTGPGQFDFWLRDVPGSWNDPKEIEWELLIDGVKSHVAAYNSSWLAQWVLGAGVHEIRLVFRNNTGVEGPAFIAVDDVSWEPLVPGPGGGGWTASHPELVDGFAEGGFGDGPQHVIPVATGEVRWIEKTVTGPGVLGWNTRLTYKEYRAFNRQVLINGICSLPLDWSSGWETNRLHIPEGVHTVRWAGAPEPYQPDEPYPVQTDAIWQISNVVFTAGISPLMQGIDDEEMFWLAVGSNEGSLIDAVGSNDGEDAWLLGDETVLYLCNATLQGIKARGMVAQPDSDSGEPAWAPIFRWAGPGESAAWVQTTYGSVSYSWPCIVDQFTMEKVDVVPFKEAVDADEEFAVNGWIGLAEAGETFDGMDVAWSFLTGGYGRNIASMTLEGPAKMRFRWRSSGTGSLGLRVDGAWFPVAVPGVDWQEVEFEVYENALIEWVHAPVSETNHETPGEAWLDVVAIQSLSPRAIDAVVGEGSGLVFESTADAPEANRWRVVGYRDGSGDWQEGVRGITGVAGVQTTVTGPVLLSFRTYCAGVSIPSPVVAAGSMNPQSTIIIDTGGSFVTTRRFLSVRVGDSEKLRIIPENGDGWTEHLVRVPAGEHRVVWQLKGVTGFSYYSQNAPELQAWVGDVTLQSPEAHYELWADQFLDDNIPRDWNDDSDGDGVINFLEYAHGSDPGDGLSKPTEMFGVMQPSRELVFMPPGGEFVINGQPEKQFALHVPRMPAHVTAVLQMSTDLVTWGPTPITLRSFPSMASNPPSLYMYPRDYDSGIYQVILFDFGPEQPARFFRIKFEL